LDPPLHIEGTLQNIGDGLVLCTKKHLAAAQRTLPVEGSVIGQLYDPSLGVPLVAVEVDGSLVEKEEDLLEDLLGLGAVAQDAQGDAQHQARVGPEGLFERFGISMTCAVISRPSSSSITTVNGHIQRWATGHRKSSKYRLTRAQFRQGQG
jgi:hypothetical protein